MEEEQGMWQVKYKEDQVKYVCLSEIKDFVMKSEEKLTDSSVSQAKVEFKNPFYVPDKVSEEKDKKAASVEEQDMLDLIRGIRQFGVLVPLLVRKTKDGKYELLSGYRRKKAVEIINKDLPNEEKMKVPIIEVPDCDDDRAIVILTTSNTHRSKISLLEQIKACGYAYRAMCHRGKSSQSGKSTAEVVGNIFNVSEANVKRYSALLGLSDDLLSIIGGEDSKRAGIRCRNVDGKLKLSVRAGVLLSNLNADQQKIILRFLSDDKNVITVELASFISKKFKKNPGLKLGGLKQVVKKWKKSQEAGNTPEIKSHKISFEGLQSYFPNKNPEEIRDRVCKMLDKWLEAGSPEEFEIKSAESE